MRLFVALLVVASVASAGPIVVSGFDPAPDGGPVPGASDPAAGNFGSLAFAQDALYYLGSNVTNGNTRVAIFRDDAFAMSGFSSAFAYAGAGFNNTSNPDRSAVLGGIDGNSDNVGDWDIGFYGAGDLVSLLNGGVATGMAGSYDGAGVTLAPSATTLGDIGIIVIFGSLNDGAAIGSLSAFAAGGGGIYGVGNGPGSVATPDPDFDWLAALFPTLPLPDPMEAGSPLQGPHNGGFVPTTLGGFFANWNQYFQNPDGTQGGLGGSPESFSLGGVNSIGGISPVIGQTDGGVGAFAGQTGAPVPEPGTWVLFGVGAAVLWVRRRRNAS